MTANGFLCFFFLQFYLITTLICQLWENTSQFHKTKRWVLNVMFILSLTSIVQLSPIDATTKKYYSPADKKVTGKVTDDKGGTLSNVSVMVKGTKRCFLTLMVFLSITVSDANPVLIISYVGYKSQEISVANRRREHITHCRFRTTCMVVVGYGTLKRKSNSYWCGKCRKSELVNHLPLTNQLRATVFGSGGNSNDGEPGYDGCYSEYSWHKHAGNSRPLIVIEWYPRQGTVD